MVQDVDYFNAASQNYNREINYIYSFSNLPTSMEREKKREREWEREKREKMDDTNNLVTAFRYVPIKSHI